MTRKKWPFVALAITAILVMASSASADAISQSFDFGDVRGGYNTFIDAFGSTYPEMSANVAVSSGSLTSCYTYVQKESWLSQPSMTYFQVEINFSGNYDTPPTLTNKLDQTISASHLGVSITENSGLGSYEEYQEGDPPTPTGAIWETANADIGLCPFVVTSANGDFSESTWTESYNGQTRIVNAFNYYVTWQGYTTDSMAATIFSLVQPTNLSAVPEPATLCLLGSAAIGLIGWRARRRL